MDAERYDDALTTIDQLTAQDKDEFFDPLLSYDRRIFGEFAHDLAGIALMRLGRMAMAATAFAAAAEEAPEPLAYRAKAAAAAIAAGRQ